MYKWPISHSYVTLLECMLMTLFVVVSWLRLESINVWLHGVGCTWGRPDFQTWQHGKWKINLKHKQSNYPNLDSSQPILSNFVREEGMNSAGSAGSQWRTFIQDWQTEYRRSTPAKFNRKVADGVLMICFMISHSFLVGYWGSLIHTDSRGPFPGPAGAQLVDIRAAVWFLFLSSSRRAGSGFGRIFWSCFFAIFAIIPSISQ